MLPAIAKDAAENAIIRYDQNRSGWVLKTGGAISSIIVGAAAALACKTGECIWEFPDNDRSTR